MCESIKVGMPNLSIIFAIANVLPEPVTPIRTHRSCFDLICSISILIACSWSPAVPYSECKTNISTPQSNSPSLDGSINMIVAKRTQPVSIDIRNRVV